MFDLVSIFSRYLFVFYIVYFLLQGIFYIMIERGLKDGDILLPSKKQRYTIVLMHVVAFLIIIINPGYLIDQRLEAAVYGVLCLGFLILGFVTTNKVYKNSCPILFNGVFFLLDMGFITIYRLQPGLAVRQLLFCGVGFLIMLCIPLVFKIIPRFEKLIWLYLIAGLGLLGALFIWGSDEFGSKSWIRIGEFGFQPSEFVKILFVLFLASAFSRKLSMQMTALLCACGAVFVLMLVAQRDLGGALIFFMTFMTMLYVSTGKKTLFFFGMAGACFAAFMGVQFFPHVQERVQAWQNPWKAIDSTGYQIAQSLFAICTWGPFGRGLMRGSAASIPVVEKDFIFSAICEEFGSLFGLLLIGVYIMIFYRGVHIALRSRNTFYALISVGFTGILAFQTFVILGGVTKMIPMTGVTLPFVSYGGSSVFAYVLVIGLLQWLYKENG